MSPICNRARSQSHLPSRSAAARAGTEWTSQKRERRSVRPAARSRAPSLVGAGVGAYAGNYAGKTDAAKGSPVGSPVASTDVSMAQQALVDRGYSVGAVDGQWGPGTESALRKFQQENGLTQSGTLDAPTRSALGIAR